MQFKPREINQGLIDHVVFSIDASWSMDKFKHQVVQVIDNQIAYLAKRSGPRHEIRATVYVWDADDAYSARQRTSLIDCIFYDKDVNNVPSIKGFYTPRGNTPLIDATIRAINDLQKTATLYGDHAFLIYVITDGEENSSHATPVDLSRRINGLPVEWTLAALVPNARGKHAAQTFGFAPGNIEIWDTSSAQGIEEVGQRIQAATDSYIEARTQGIRGTRSLFLNVDNLTPSVVQSNWAEAPSTTYDILEVGPNDQYDRRWNEINPFVKRHLGEYNAGNAYYQLTKYEDDFRSDSKVVLFDKRNNSVHFGIGQDARKVLGIPDHTIGIRPSDHPDYDIFLQSKSHTRKLVPGTKVIVFK